MNSKSYFRNFRLCALLTVCLLIHEVPFAQDLGRSYIPPSPQAASLGMFVDATRGNYSGYVDIGVPLYTIEDGDIKVPISLSYFTGGIKQSDQGSWTGMNWVLNAGGVLGRVKKDRDDFETHGYYKINPNSFPSGNDWDQEPDIFYYNVNGYSGKFILIYNANSPGYTVMHVKKSNIKIELLINAWRLTTPDGIQYYFDRTETTNEQLVNSGGSGNENVTFTSAWYLTKIQSTTGRIVSFGYHYVQNKVQSSYTQISRTTLFDVLPHGYTSCIQPDDTYNSQHTSTSNIQVDEVLLQSITFSDGQVEFMITPRIDLNTVTGNGSKLSSINIKKHTNTGVGNYLTFNFDYDYYYSNDASKPDKISKRLRLLSVQEVNGSQVKPPYVFNYAGNYLPNKIGQNFLNYVQPSQFSMLNKIVYPTGGSTTYEFESNSVVDVEGTTWPVGTRIKSITQDDGISTNNNIKKFYYSGGKLLGRFSPGTATITTSPSQFQNCPTPGYTTTLYFWYRHETLGDCSSVSEMADNQILGYDEVTVLHGENGEYGKSIYEFINSHPSNPYTYPAGVKFFMPMAVSQQTGALKSLTEYRFDGTLYVPVQKKQSSYVSFEMLNHVARRRVGGTCYNYDFKTEWVQKTQDHTYTYNQNGANYLQETETYHYTNNQHLLPTGSLKTSSKGETIQTVSRYTHEIAATLTGTVYNTMVQKHIITPLLEQTVTNNNVTTSVFKTTYKDWFNNGAVIAPEKLTMVKGSDQPAPSRSDVTEFAKYDDFGNPLELNRTEDGRKSYIWDAKGKYPIAEVENASNNVIGFSGFEDLQHKYFAPVGNYHGVYQNLESHTGKFSLKYLNSYSGFVRHDFFPTERGKYLFSCWVKTTSGYDGSGNLILNTGTVANPSAVFPSSSTESYKTQTITNTQGVWKYFSVILDLDKVYADMGNNTPLAIRASITNGDPANHIYLDDLRFHPLDSKMTTYTYEQLVGMTSSTSANNKVSYFEYDDLNRLKLIRNHEKMIVKKICYNYAGQVENCPNSTNPEPQWAATGQTRCVPCPANPSYNSGVREKLEQDINPYSPSHTNTRWVVDLSGTCPTPADWQPRTDMAYCEDFPYRTGNKITPTVDVNPCSPTYNTWGTPIIQVNAPECQVCTVPCNAPQYKCINGVCVSGEWKIVKVIRIDKFTWECKYGWCFPDGTIGNYFQSVISSTACSIECL